LHSKAKQLEAQPKNGVAYEKRVHENKGRYYEAYICQRVLNFFSNDHKHV